MSFAQGYGYLPGWPAADSIEWIGNWANMLGAGAASLVLTLFPTGGSLGRGRRALVWAGAVSAGLGLPGQR